MRLTISVLLVLAAAGCGGDDKKVTTATCADDADCAGGLCFESVCYTACTDSIDPCAQGEACVLRIRDDGEHAVCVAAAQIQCATHDDCAEVHSRECLHAKCDPDTLLCTLAELPDATACTSYPGFEGSDWAGSDACPAPGGFQCPCVDGSACTSGSCVDTPLGPLCTQPCVDQCPAGWECRQVAAGGDSLFACAAVDPNRYGVCFHGDCRAPCTLDNDCPEVCALKYIGNDQLYCGLMDQLACQADGFGDEFADACSSIWKRENLVCEFSTSAVGPGTVPANACDGGVSACISEGCALVCKSDADCSVGACVGFYSFDETSDGTGIGFFKACR